MKVRAGWDILRGTVNEFFEDRALRLSAAMAYYAVFSLGPLLVLVVGLAGLALGEQTVNREIERQLQGLLGENSAKMVESMMQAQHKGGSTWATILGGVGLLIAASGIFGQLQDALNTIWEVKARPKQGLWGFLRQRFLSMGMVLVIGFLLLVSMVLTTFVHAFVQYISAVVTMPPWSIHVLNEGFSLALTTLLFAMIFKVLPDVQIRWSDVWIGALGTALLFTLGQFLLGLYLGRESTTSSYGAAGAFVLLLLYIYYSTLILFFGAEFTQVYVRRRGAQIRPSNHAVPVSEEERQEGGMPREKATAKSGARPEGSPQPGLVPAPTYSMKQEVRHPFQENPAMRAPGEQVRAHAWSFVAIAAAAGFGMALVMRYLGLRRAFRWYATARKFI